MLVVCPESGSVGGEKVQIAPTSRSPPVGAPWFRGFWTWFGRALVGEYQVDTVSLSVIRLSQTSQERGLLGIDGSSPDFIYVRLGSE